MINLINFNRFVSFTTIEGPGKRFALWMQGCIINCKGCSNQEMIPLINRNVMEVSDLFKAIRDAKERFQIEGITILGGEPFIQPRALLELVTLCQTNNLTVIVFSGFLYELLQEKHPAILSKIDILIDGPFIIEKLDKKRRLIGSTNQRVIKLSDVYQNNDYFEQNIIEAEFTVTKNNSIIINGDGAHLVNNEEKIKKEEAIKMGALKLGGDVFSHFTQDIIKVGDKLEFKGTNADMSDFHLSDVKTQYKVISVIPSIDTSVCYTQTIKFNKNMKDYPNARLITVSRDLPFAQERCCKSFIDEEHFLVSDYNYRDFGTKTGLVFTAFQILPRVVIILNQDNIVEYLEIVNPIGNEPNYKAIYDFLDSRK
ncbi:MAG: 4Fe-4S cluster-binding domain-containing protein [Spiroplasma phoeniceum]|nr:MAG: 4Fe-4S cluster-binding domain-containing protein [Spiroplasma phoeniceum]UZQ31680.1 MAG: 4Fe-4S cluster-binding domain-containing protein [Spiroplasma phoeniceum]